MKKDELNKSDNKKVIESVKAVINMSAERLVLDAGGN